jgi:hypothetical protein
MTQYNLNGLRQDHDDLVDLLRKIPKKAKERRVIQGWVAKIKKVLHWNDKKEQP